MNTNFLLVVCALVVVLAVTTPCSALLLPDAFVGHWRGVPSASVLGPWSATGNAPFNFTIAERGDVPKGRGWLMGDTFEGYWIKKSVQQFWVNTNEDGTVGNMTYCGALRNFFIPANPGTVKITFNQTKLTPNEVVWEYFGSDYKFRWTLTLSRDGQQLTSTFQLPVPVVHFNATFDRVAEHEVSAIRSQLKSPATRAPLGAPCNISVAPNRRVGRVVAVEDEEPSGCPLGFTSRHGPMPEHIRKMLDERRAASKKKAAEKTAGKVVDGGRPQHCYKFNPSLNLSIAWDWNTAAEDVTITVSANVSKADPFGTGPGMFNEHNAYVAIGFFPTFPGMSSMDIALGHFATKSGQGCVRSMWAKNYIGTPVEGVEATQKITNTSIWTKAGEPGMVYMKFTRAWNTGHMNIATPTVHGFLTVAFAVGGAPGTCSEPPQYHGASRGQFGVWWSAPEAVLPDNMKC